MGLHQIKFLDMKRNSSQNQEISHRMVENLHQLFYRQRISIHNIQRAQKTEQQNPQIVQLINGEIN
jgi:uncharacterized protein YpiB (UPF0302 family)